MSIDEIMDMLDWNNDDHIQKEGRRLAANITCVNVFILPKHERHNKNVWLNCAMVLASREDEVLKPYLRDLIRWLIDEN